MAVTLSFFGGVNIILSGIIVCIFACLMQLIHMPEDMPGVYDNPDGESFHPKSVFLSMSGLFILLLIFGKLFPAMCDYQAFGS
jgi:ABC-type antimicrobial peptide transport system permease subunit